MIKDQLGLTVEIVEDDGFPNDFIIKVSSQELDKERQLIALIDKYKQAGKSFSLNNSSCYIYSNMGRFCV